MSYILEALRKSEQKRKQETVPGLQTVHENDLADTKQKKPLWPWIALAALCINAVVLLMFLPSWEKDKSLTVSETAGQQQISNLSFVPDTNVSSATFLETESVSVIQPGPDSGSMSRERETGLQATSILPGIAAPTPVPAGQLTAGPPAIPILPQQADITFQPLLTTDEQKEKNTQGTNPVIITGETAEEVKLVSTPLEDPLETDQLAALSNNETTAVDKDQNKKIPLLGNLPRSIRAELPELSISFHAYAKKPKSRLVSINGRVLRQDQSIANGLTVEEITSDGIILNFKGNLFRMEVF